MDDTGDTYLLIMYVELLLSDASNQCTRSPFTIIVLDELI